MKGKVFEELAVEYLSERGYKILERNLRSPYGEIDILAQKDGRKVIIEVKGGNTYFPAEKLTKEKVKRLLKTFLFHYNEDFSLEFIVVYKGKIYHYKNLEWCYEEEF
ncbi:YraN family protein [Aquifex pyrophilus]